MILLHSTGGLIVAIVTKYADNILKGFATSFAIVVACIFSIYFFNFKISLQFVVGALLVMVSIFLFSYTKERKSQNLETVQKE